MKRAKKLIAVLCAIFCLTSFLAGSMQRMLALAEDAGELKEITPQDFGIADGVYTEYMGKAYQGGDTLFGTIFSAIVKFDGDECWFHYAATQRWYGMSFRITESGITLKSDTKDFTGVYTFDSETAGTELYGNSFLLQLSLEACDHTGDGTPNDAKLGVYFDKKLYNNTFIYLDGAVDTLGAKLYMEADCRGGGDGSTDGTVYELATPKAHETDEMQIPYEYAGKSFEKFGMENGACAEYDSTQSHDFETPSLYSGKVTLAETSSSASLQLAQYDNLISYADFGIADSPDGGYTTTVTGSYGQTLDKTYFEGELCLTNVGIYLYYGGVEATKGLRFQLSSSNLLLKSMDDTSVSIKFAPSVIDATTFKNETFRLGISTQVKGEDVLLGVWFNDELCKESDFADLTGATLSQEGYITLTDYSQYLGNTLTIKPTSSKAIHVASQYPDVSERNLPFALTSKAIGGVTFGVSDKQKLHIGGVLEQDIADVAMGDEFSFSIACLRSDLQGDNQQNDLTWKIWINGEPLTDQPIQVENGIDVSRLNGLLMKCSIQTAELTTWYPEEDLKEYSYNLSDGDYMITANGNVTINQQDGYGAGDTLSVPGEYTLIREDLDEIRAQRIVLWKTGWVTSDKELDIRDLVAAKKCAEQVELTTSRKKGADLDFDGTVTDKDVSKMAGILIGSEELNTVSPKQAFTYEDNVMPIGGYFGPLGSHVDSTTGHTTYDQLTDDVFGLIDAAGINLITYTEFRYEADANTVLKGLELGEKYGIDMYVRQNYDDSWNDTRYAQMMSRFSKYQSFRGLTVWDEPTGTVYPDSTTNGGTMQSYAPYSSRANTYCNLTGYMNLLPYYSHLTTDKETYRSYLDEYCTTCKPRVLSFDHYVWTKKAISEHFWNLSVVREKAQQYKIPFWGVVQAGDSDGGASVTTNIMPTLGQTKWHVNTMLAYGAKGIQYFPLVQPYFYTYKDGVAGQDFNRSGLIGANGATTEFYSQALTANTQIQAVDEVLMNCVSTDILAVGTQAQEQTGITKTSYAELTGISVAKKGFQDIIKNKASAIVGCFDYHGKTALYVVNNDYENEREITMNFDGSHALSLISATLNETINASTYTVKLAAGDAVLVVID